MFNFRLDVYLHHTGESELLRRIDALSQRLDGMAESLEVIHQQGVIMAGELARLQTEVTEMSGVVDSAIVLINGLAQQIRDLATDPAALAALADELDAKANALAAAISANTAPPAPEPQVPQG
jgi:uncharacterized protein YoxC